MDDTIEVREVHQPNDGRDPFPVLICRQRLSKNRKDLPGKMLLYGLCHLWPVVHDAVASN